MARDVADHLGVVVGGEEGLVLAAVGHRDPADEVGEPDVGRPLLARVLVEIVVDLPRLVADHEVVVAFAHDVVEDHEVVDQDLVHAADRLKAMQVVLGGLALDVLRLAREVAARRMDRLALPFEDARDGCCASQSIWTPSTRWRSARAIATSRCAWPRPIGDEM